MIRESRFMTNRGTSEGGKGGILRTKIISIHSHIVIGQPQRIEGQMSVSWSDSQVMIEGQCKDNHTEEHVIHG
jgi:hypothetical protein